MPGEISILAGGWSAGIFDLCRLPGVVIGVNEGALQRNVAIGLTMDRLWAEIRWRELAAAKLQQVWIRRSATQNFTDRHYGSLKIKVFECDHKSTEMVDQPGRLNGTSSGMCAMNLAYQMRPERLYLFGYDCNRSPSGQAYWHAPHAWGKSSGSTGLARYAEWAAEYARIAPQMQAAGIEVLNMSATSAISAFPRGPIERIPKR